MLDTVHISATKIHSKLLEVRQVVTYLKYMEHRWKITFDFNLYAVSLSVVLVTYFRDWTWRSEEGRKMCCY